MITPAINHVERKISFSETFGSNNNAGLETQQSIR